MNLGSATNYEVDLKRKAEYSVTSARNDLARHKANGESSLSWSLVIPPIIPQKKSFFSGSKPTLSPSLVGARKNQAYDFEAFLSSLVKYPEQISLEDTILITNYCIDASSMNIEDLISKVMLKKQTIDDKLRVNKQDEKDSQECDKLIVDLKGIRTKRFSILLSLVKLIGAVSDQKIKQQLSTAFNSLFITPNNDVISFAVQALCVNPEILYHLCRPEVPTTCVSQLINCVAQFSQPKQQEILNDFDLIIKGKAANLMRGSIHDTPLAVEQIKVIEQRLNEINLSATSLLENLREKLQTQMNLKSVKVVSDLDERSVESSKTAPDSTAPEIESKPASPSLIDMFELKILTKEGRTDLAKKRTSEEWKEFCDSLITKDTIPLEDLYDIVVALSVKEAVADSGLADSFKKLLQAKAQKIIPVLFAQPVLMYYLCRDVGDGIYAARKQKPWKLEYRIGVVLEVANDPSFEKKRSEYVTILEATLRSIDATSVKEIESARKEYAETYPWFAKPELKVATPSRFGFSQKNENEYTLNDAIVTIQTAKRMNVDLANKVSSILNSTLSEEDTAISENEREKINQKYLENAAYILVHATNNTFKSEAFLAAVKGGYSDDQRLEFIGHLFNLSQGVSEKNKARILKQITIQIENFKAQNADLHKLFNVVFSNQHFDILKQYMELTGDEAKPVIDGVKSLYAKCISAELFQSLDEKKWEAVVNSFSPQSEDSYSAAVQSAIQKGWSSRRTWLANHPRVSENNILPNSIVAAFWTGQSIYSSPKETKVWPYLLSAEDTRVTNAIDTARGKNLSHAEWKKIFDQAKNHEAELAIKGGWWSRWTWLKSHPEISGKNRLFHWMAAFFTDKKGYMVPISTAMGTANGGNDISSKYAIVPLDEDLSHGAPLPVSSTAAATDALSKSYRERCTQAATQYNRKVNGGKDEKYIQELLNNNSWSEFVDIYIGLRENKKYEKKLERFMLQIRNQIMPFEGEKNTANYHPEALANICMQIKSDMPTDAVYDFLKALAKVSVDYKAEKAEEVEEVEKIEAYTDKLIFQMYMPLSINASAIQALKTEKEKLTKFLASLPDEKLSALWVKVALFDQGKGKSAAASGKLCLEHILLSRTQQIDDSSEVTNIKTALLSRMRGEIPEQQVETKKTSKKTKEGRYDLLFSHPQSSNNPLVSIFDVVCSAMQNRERRAQAAATPTKQTAGVSPSRSQMS